MAWSTPARRTSLLAIGLAFVLAACAGAEATPTPAPATPTPAPPVQTEQPSESTGPAELPEPELKELQIGLSGEYSANVMHSVMAQALDLPAKYGFDKIEFSNFSGGSQVVQALLAGQIDASDNSGGPVVASLATSSPLIMAFITRSNLTDNLYSQASVTSGEQLKGGSIAISSFGSQSHAGALVSLKALGLTPQDVTITQVGNDSARAAALQAGSVTASMNDAVKEQELAGLGFNILVRLAKEPGLGGVARTSLTFNHDFIAQYPNTVLNLVAMYLEANLAWRADPETGAKELAELSGMDEADALADIQSALTEPWEPLDGRCDPEVMRFTQETLLPANPDLASVNPTDACTNEFIDKLEEMGIMEALGVPGY